MKNKGLHPKNKFRNGYDLRKLAKIYPEIERFIILGKHGKLTIDFANSKAVKALNTALLLSYSSISYWDFPEENLCPPIPGRLDYIHVLADLIGANQKKTILDIGTGATCIYPLLGFAEYGWKFIGTDVNTFSLKSAKHILRKNKLDAIVALKHQKETTSILSGILTEKETINAVMCNPPFYSSEEEANQATLKKAKNLVVPNKRNFKGKANELWYKGGEKAFLHTYLYESSLLILKDCWFTSLVSKKENVKSLEKSFKKLNVAKHNIFPLQHGNKVSRVIAWRF